jgi:hypothetical protein
MNSEAYRQWFDDRVAGEISSVSKTSSGHYRLPKDVAREMPDEDDQEEYAESYLEGFLDAGKSQAW